jgi:CRISPR-associated endonuclease/helicase Cas3
MVLSMRGTKALVIRNTVPAAVATLKAREACPQPLWLFSLKGEITLHHSRFSRQDRPLLDVEPLGRQMSQADGVYVA